MLSKAAATGDLSVRISFWLIATITTLWIGLNLYSSYEARLFPVVRDFEITAIEPRDSTVAVSGRMRKVRDCRYLGLVAYAGDYRNSDALRERLFVRYLDHPAERAVSREPGYQNWGPWEIARPGTVSGPHLWIRVTHDCNRLFETTGVYMIRDAHDVFATPPR